MTMNHPALCQPELPHPSRVKYREQATAAHCRKIESNIDIARHSASRRPSRDALKTVGQAVPSSLS